jgi:hypothetical protein
MGLVNVPTDPLDADDDEDELEPPPSDETRLSTAPMAFPMLRKLMMILRCEAVAPDVHADFSVSLGVRR